MKIWDLLGMKIWGLLDMKKAILFTLSEDEG